MSFRFQEGMSMAGRSVFTLGGVSTSHRSAGSGWAGAAAALAYGILAASGAPTVHAEFEDMLLDPVVETGYPITDFPEIGIAAASGPVWNGSAVVPMIVDGFARPVVNVTIGGENIPMLVDTGSRGTFVSLAEFAEGPNPLVSWLDSPLINWIPGVSDTIDTFSTILNLVEKLGLPTSFPRSDFGYIDGPGYTYIPFEARDGIGFGHDLITGQQVSTGTTVVNVIISEWGVFDSRFWEELRNPSENYIDDYLFDSSARGVMGVGLGADGPGPIVTTALPGDLGRGIVIDMPSGQLTLGIPRNFVADPNRIINDGSDETLRAPWAEGYISFNGGERVPVRAMYDSGGAFGSLSGTLFNGPYVNTNLIDLETDIFGNDYFRVVPNTTISVYNEYNQLVYSFRTTQEWSTKVVSQSWDETPTMNTGAWPFLNTPMFICTDKYGCPEIF